MTALLALVFGLSLPPSVKPWPIGAGQEFRIPAAPAAVQGGRPIGRFRCTRKDSGRVGVHVELFVRRQVLIIPAGIGVARPSRTAFSRVRPGGCTYALRTLDPTGTIEAAGPATLGGFFRIWGQPLGPRRIAGFRSRQRILVFVNGRWRGGDPRRVPLTPHANIVLVLGGYVPPHPSYLFPPGL